VQRTPVDYLVCGGHKWLNAPAGRGFLYVRDCDRWQAPASGYLNIEEPPGGWANYFGDPSAPAVRDYAFVRSARKFEIGGTANYPGNVVLAKSLEMINELGIDRIEEHIMHLTDRLMSGLDDLSVSVVSPRERASRSGIVTFTLGHGVEPDRALLNSLLDRGILLSMRYTAGIGGLRASLHFFNNENDVTRLLDAVRAFQR
jgi:cysteine desulfurase/selenocysteine lyase